MTESNTYFYLKFCEDKKDCLLLQVLLLKMKYMPLGKFFILYH